MPGLPMLNKQIDFYKKHRKSFEKIYHGKYIVISDRKVIGVYESHREAYDESIKLHEIGSFIIEHPKEKK